MNPIIDPTNPNYQHRAAHPDFFHTTIGDILPLHEQESTYLQHQQFDLFYAFSTTNEQYTPKRIHLPALLLGSYKTRPEKIIDEGLQIAYSENSFGGSIRGIHPSLHSPEIVLHNIEHIILQQSHRFNRTQSPIPLIICDSTWLTTLDTFKNKYSVQEYCISSDDTSWTRINWQINQD